MKKPDWDKLVPLGLSARQEGNWMAAGLVLAALCSLQIPVRYFQYLLEVLDTLRGENVAIERTYMIPFVWLLDDGLELFPIFLWVMPVLVVYHYLYHRMGTESRYLMRRLPNRWEYHRRCWGMPVVGAAAALALMGALVGLYYLIYILATPAQCLPGA